MRLRDDDQHLCGIVHRKFLEVSKRRWSQHPLYKILRVADRLASPQRSARSGSPSHSARNCSTCSESQSPPPWSPSPQTPPRYTDHSAKKCFDAWSETLVETEWSPCRSRPLRSSGTRPRESSSGNRPSCGPCRSVTSPRRPWPSWFSPLGVSIAFSGRSGIIAASASFAPASTASAYFALALISSWRRRSIYRGCDRVSRPHSTDFGRSDTPVRTATTTLNPSDSECSGVSGWPWTAENKEEEER